MCGHHGNGFCKIEGRAATNCNNAITASLMKHGSCLDGGCFIRIAGRFVEDGGGDNPRYGFDPLQDAKRSHAFVGDDDRT